MKIAFLEPLGISSDALKETINNYISSDEHEIVYYADRKEDEATLIERSKDADIVVLSNIKYGKNIIEKCPNLKMINVAFTGVDHIDMAYCNERGIDVCNCSGYSTVAVADIVFGMAINLARYINETEKKVRALEGKGNLIGFELEGKTFGIIGVGEIGKRVAKIADAFGCKVIAYSRTPKDIDYIEFKSFEEVLKESDILSIHVPQNSETINLISAKELAMMKNTAILINTARGPIVNSADLTEALNNGTIAAAGVDVFNAEPPLTADEPLLSAPNTLLTPHIAFASHQAFEKRAEIVGANLKLWLEGTPQNIMNK